MSASQDGTIIVWEVGGYSVDVERGKAVGTQLSAKAAHRLQNGIGIMDLDLCVHVKGPIKNTKLVQSASECLVATEAGLVHRCVLALDATVDGTL